MLQKNLPITPVQNYFLQKELEKIIQSQKELGKKVTPIFTFIAETAIKTTNVNEQKRKKRKKKAVDDSQNK